MRELNDADVLQHFPLHLPIACQTLRDKGHSVVRPDIIDKILGSLTQDGRETAARAAFTSAGGHIDHKHDTTSAFMVSARTHFVSPPPGSRLLLEHLLGKVPERVYAARTSRWKPLLVILWPR